jgi:hypothetical protein
VITEFWGRCKVLPHNPKGPGAFGPHLQNTMQTSIMQETGLMIGGPLDEQCKHLEAVEGLLRQLNNELYKLKELTAPSLQPGAHRDELNARHHVRYGHMLDQCRELQLALLRREDSCEEEHHEVVFNGYVVDLFSTESSSLGITVERAPAGEDGPFRDIFVSPELVVTGVA